MNDHILRIKTIDEQLKALERITKQGEYIAAGLSIQVTVGAPNEGDQPTLNIGLCNNLDQILGALKSGLEQARNERTLMAKSELKELQAFFDKEWS